MKKIIELPERFVTGEPTLSVIAHWNGQKHLYEKNASKFASEAYDYIQAVTPRDGETIVLVNALGVFEHYDDNRNGDAFNESAYKVGIRPICKCDKCQLTNWKNGWVSDDETIPHHYKSFEKHGGIYQHHVNKDPTKSLGKVEKAFWNSRMHRVELLLAIVNKRAPEWIEEIENGTYAPVSMGCHVRFDLCSNCGHKAPTRKDYCEHLKYDMRKIDPITGVKNCALNPSPKFFDISKVFRPADPQGFMIKKVAEESVYSFSLEEKVADFESKQATIGKLSDIQKIITGEISHAKLNPSHKLLINYKKNIQPNLEEATNSDIDVMSEHSIPEVVSTLAEKGAGLTTKEFFKLFCKKANLGIPNSDILDKAVLLQPLMTKLFQLHPDFLEKISDIIEINKKYINNDLAIKLNSWIEKRSTIGDYLLHSLGGSNLPGTQWIRDKEPPKTDVLYVTDPNTGARHTTTRGAIMAASDEDSKADITRRLGASLALSNAYRLSLGRLLPGAHVIGGIYTANKLMDHYPKHPSFISDEGYSVPGMTEMIKENQLNPIIPTSKYFDLMLFDQNSIKEKYATVEMLQPFDSTVSILFYTKTANELPELNYNDSYYRLGLLLTRI